MAAPPSRPFSMPVDAGLPAGAVPAAGAVLAYSMLCLLAGFLLIATLLLNKERWSYVLLFSISTTCSTVVAIAQQAYYLTHWNKSRLQVYYAALAVAKEPALSFGPFTKGFGSVTFWLQIYLFNVDALLVLFWAISLTFEVWDWRTRYIYDRKATIGIVSKVVALLLPALIAGLRASTTISVKFGIGFFLNSFCLVMSFSLGALFIALILVKYIHTRAVFASRSGSIRIEDIPMSPNEPHCPRRRPRLRHRVDQWLIIRFTTAFFILSGFNIFLIFYSIGRYQQVMDHKATLAPEFTVSRAVSDILNYIPPVTASLIAFFLFGTTLQSRTQLANIFGYLKCWGKRSRPSTTRREGSRPEHWHDLSSSGTAGTDVTKPSPALPFGSYEKRPKRPEPSLSQIYLGRYRSDG